MIDPYAKFKPTELQYLLATTYKADIIAWMRLHPEAFDEALALTLAERSPYSWRASWVLWSVMEKNDARIRKHIPRIIRILPLRRDSEQRELLKILQNMRIPVRHEGPLFDACVDLWQSIGKPPSVRHNAFRLIAALAAKYPELRAEVALLTRGEYMDTLSPGVRHSIQRMLQAPKQ